MKRKIITQKQLDKLVSLGVVKRTAEGTEADFLCRNVLKNVKRSEE